LRYARIIPPTTTPQMLPIPPRMTMQSRNDGDVEVEVRGKAPDLKLA
jgi:hypothetical protein